MSARSFSFYSLAPKALIARRSIDMLSTEPICTPHAPEDSITFSLCTRRIDHQYHVLCVTCNYTTQLAPRFGPRIARAPGASHAGRKERSRMVRRGAPYPRRTPPWPRGLALSLSCTDVTMPSGTKYRLRGATFLHPHGTSRQPVNFFSFSISFSICSCCRLATILCFWPVRSAFRQHRSQHPHTFPARQQLSRLFLLPLLPNPPHPPLVWQGGVWGWGWVWQGRIWGWGRVRQGQWSKRFSRGIGSSKIKRYEGG